MWKISLETSETLLISTRNPLSNLHPVFYDRLFATGIIPFFFLVIFNFLIYKRYAALSKQQLSTVADTSTLHQRPGPTMSVSYIDWFLDVEMSTRLGMYMVELERWGSKVLICWAVFTQHLAASMSKPVIQDVFIDMDIYWWVWC